MSSRSALEPQCTAINAVLQTAVWQRPKVKRTPRETRASFHLRSESKQRARGRSDGRTDGVAARDKQQTGLGVPLQSTQLSSGRFPSFARDCSTAVLAAQRQHSTLVMWW